MGFEPWVLAAMEDHGYMDTRTGQINRMAIWLQEHMYGTEIDQPIFEAACHACGVDADTFTQADLERLLQRMNRGY